MQEVELICPNEDCEISYLENAMVLDVNDPSIRMGVDCPSCGATLIPVAPEYEDEGYEEWDEEDDELEW